MKPVVELAMPMQEGEMLRRNPNKPAIILNRNGRDSYLWIGNDAEKDKACFATLSGRAALKRLANAILEEVS